MSIFTPIRLAILACFATLSATSAKAQPATEYYGSVRGWDVEAIYVGGQMSGCVMSRAGDYFDFGLIKDQNEWFLGFPSSQFDGSQGFAWVEVGGSGFELSTTVDWGIANGYINQRWVNAIGSGSRMYVEFEGGRYTLSLDGTAAAIGLVTECDANNGVLPHANNTQNYGNNCPEIGSVWSPQSQGWGNSNFTNYSNENVELYWIDFNGSRQLIADLFPGQSTYVRSTAGHLFIARGYSGYCYGGIIEMSPGEGNYNIQ